MQFNLSLNQLQLKIIIYFQVKILLKLVTFCHEFNVIGNIEVTKLEKNIKHKNKLKCRPIKVAFVETSAVHPSGPSPGCRSSGAKNDKGGTF